MTANRLQHFLLDPASYPDRPAAVTCTETHVSRLYFTPDRVYKVKKPVNFGFLDFTSLGKRHFFCQEELRLNRRFAPNTYERVAVVRRQHGQFNLDGAGRAVEYAVVMQRLPERLLLSTLLAQNAPTLDALVPPLGRHLATLHRTSTIWHADGDEPAASVMQRNWQENFAQMHPLAGTTIPPHALLLCRGWVINFFDRHRDLLAERQAAGWVRDGHGDLHAEHICLTDPIRIYDCIEFNRRFRIGDILSDLAFLLMDLDFRGRPDLAERLLQAWQNELAPLQAGDGQLLRFYRLYRAFVRGKVDTFLAHDTSAPEPVREEATALARRYFNLALGYLLQPTLILTCGLMGVGKTTLARPLAQALRADLLRSDVVRKELAGIPPTQAAAADFAAGLYSNAWNERTYTELLERARAGLSAGRSVVVDAAFGHHGDRERFFALARCMSCPVQLLHLSCHADLTRQRLLQRQRGESDASDGRVELLSRQAATFEPPHVAENALPIDAERALDYNVQTVVLQLLTRFGAIAP